MLCCLMLFLIADTKIWTLFEKSKFFSLFLKDSTQKVVYVIFFVILYNKMAQGSPGGYAYEQDTLDTEFEYTDKEYCAASSDSSSYCII
jgi:hypothetical protein